MSAISYRVVRSDKSLVALLNRTVDPYPVLAVEYHSGAATIQVTLLDLTPVSLTKWRAHNSSNSLQLFLEYINVGWASSWHIVFG